MNKKKDVPVINPLTGGTFGVCRPEDASEIQKALGAKAEGALAYCKKKGWNPDKLSIPQIIEIVNRKEDE